MREAVGQQDLRARGQLGHIARQRIAHLNRAGQLRPALLQHLGEVLACVTAARKVQRDLPAFAHRDDPAGKHAGALILGVALQRQHTHAGVIVMHHIVLCRLPDQLIQRRFERLRGLFDDLPLRSRRQRDTHLRFQLLQPVERSSGAVLELSDHRRGRFIVLIRPHPFRLLRREDLTAGSATQPFQRVNGSCQRRLADNSH